MEKIFEKFCEFTGWYSNERIKDYRENTNIVVGAISQKESQINAIILAGSVAGLTAVAALNKDIFSSSVNISIMAFIVIGLFILVILFSIINLYLSTLALANIQKTMIENFITFKLPKKDIKNYRFKKAQQVLSLIVLIGFCLGLVLLLILLGLYLFGANR